MHRASAGVLILSVIAGCRSNEPLGPLMRERPSPSDVSVSAALAPNQSAADAISANIRRLHMPYGTLADPGFASSDPSNTTVVSYNRTGDGAIWTGHYLAAESFRYAVTRTSDALDAVKKALDGVQSLVDVTTAQDPDVLARSWVPANSPYLGKIMADEGHNGMYPTLYDGQQVFWIGNTSRDQYLGTFFGLAVAYDFVPDAGVRKQASALVSRLLDNLLLHGWSVPMPSGTPPFSTTFVGRPDEQLTLLQIGRHVNPGNVKYQAAYTALGQTNAPLVIAPVAGECQDTYGSYYKFNLDYIDFFNLVHSCYTAMATARSRPRRSITCCRIGWDGTTA